MPTPSQLVKAGALKAVGGAGAASHPDNSLQAGSLLSGRLKTIQQHGTPSQLAKARKVAKGGSPSVAARAMEGLGLVLGAPLRAVVATGDEAGELIGARKDAQGWWDKFKDPSYGFGRVLEKNAPNAPIWAKRAAGFAGDVAFDPLTYMTFGASPLIKEAGRSSGLARLAFDAADGAEALSKLDEADRLRALGAKALHQGAHKLDTVELDELAQLAGHKAGDFRYGVSWEIPFTKKGGVLAGKKGTGPFAAYGRGLEGSGRGIVRSVRDTRVGSMVSGNLAELTKGMESGNPITSRIASRVKDAWEGGMGRASYAERELSVNTGKLFRESKKVMDGQELMRGLREAPTIVDGVESAAGPTYTKLMEDPTTAPLFGKWLEVLRDTPEFAKKAASFGDQAKTIIHDATEEGRPYAPRVMSDEYKKIIGASQPGRETAPQQVWLQKKALTVGDKIGDVELLRPGTLDDAGQLVPALEEQTRAALEKVHGTQAVDWYEPDFYKAWPKYQSGVAESVRNGYIENMLHAKGISNEKYTYLLDLQRGERKLTIKEMAGKAGKAFSAARDNIDSTLAQLNDVNSKLDEVRKAVSEGRMSVDEAQAEVKKLSKHKADAHARIVAGDRKVSRLRRAWTAAQHEENKALDEHDVHVEMLNQQKEMVKFLQGKIDQMDLAADESWPELRRLVGERDAAEARVAELATAKGHVNRLYADAARGHAVAREIEDVLKAGEGFDPSSPLTDMMEKVADDMNLPLNEQTAQQVANMLKGTADRSLEELGRYVPLAPSTANPQQLRGEIGGGMKRMKAAGQAMMQSTDQASFDAAKQAYEQAAEEVAHRRNLLDLHHEYGGAPTFGQLDDAHQAAVHDLIAAQVELSKTLATPKERTMASMANGLENWAAEGMPNGPLPNPSGGTTWYHGAYSEMVNVNGDFPLEKGVQYATPSWMDNLFGPSMSSEYGFSSAWVSGDPMRVQEMLLNAKPERVLVYGTTVNTYDDLVDVVNPSTGVIDKSMIQGSSTEQLAEAIHPGGSGYQKFMVDAVSRAVDEDPSIIGRLLEGLKAEGAKATDQYEQQAIGELHKMYDQALKIQNYARGVDRRLSFGQAMDTGLAWMEDYGPGVPFDYSALQDPTFPIPHRDDYMPFASQALAYAFSDAVPMDVRMDMARTMRSSLARDGDVIIFVQAATHKIDNYQNMIFHALPTNQFTLEPLDHSGKSLGLRRHIAETVSSYSGKHVDFDTYMALHTELMAANDTLSAVNTQFQARATDLADATVKRQRVQQQLYKAIANRDQSSATLAIKEALLGEAEEAYKARSLAQDELEARLHHLEGNAKQLEATLLSHDIEKAYAGKMTERVQRLRDTLGQDWEGFGYNREAPSLVNQYLADIAKSYNPVEGEGLRSFLTKFDHVNNWMKGWLTSSIGFQTRNIMGGTFNNWLAGVDIIHSGRGWGEIYFDKMSPRAVAKARESGQALEATPFQQLAFNIGNRIGVVRSGLYSSELGHVQGTLMPGADRGWSFNPLGQSMGGDKPFLLPFITRKAGEQAAEPFLRGSLYYDRLLKSIKRGRFAEVGLHGIEDVTAENMAKLEQHILASPLIQEVTADINKYHFNYDDLSRFERQVGRRVIPFYTWTRKNVPLQLEAFATQPGKAFNRYFAVKRNLELGTPEESVVPSYFGESAMIHLPWKVGGSDTYGTVELPWKDPFKTADITGQLTGMLNPLIKAPLEAVAGRQFYSDVPITPAYKPVTGTWLPLVPIMAATGDLPFTPWDKPVKSKDGQWMMRDKDQYLIGQYLPFLGQTRRLLPTEPKYENRLWSTAISYMMGVNLRTNTPQDQESELFRRAKTLEGVGKDLQNLGYVTKKPKKAGQKKKGMTLNQVLASVPEQVSSSSESLQSASE